MAVIQTKDSVTSIDPRLSADHDNDLVLLIDRCANHDQAAFESLYSRTSPQLFGVLRRMLKVMPAAEDALQETYIKIWNNAGSFKRELGSPMTWMISIARYHALDVLRKYRTREDLESDVPLDTVLEQDGGSDTLPVDITDSDILDTCLGRLDPPVRNSIIKAYCEGYSHDELSHFIDAPLGTVKSWIRRGLITLRGCLDELS